RCSPTRRISSPTKRSPRSTRISPRSWRRSEARAASERPPTTLHRKRRSSLSIPDLSAKPLSEIVSLAGRTAVVTGAAWGLGKATARRLAEAGASVLIGDIDAEKAAATALEISEAYGRRVLSLPMDVTDKDAVVAAADLAVQEFGGIDVWVNNAGIPSFTPLLDLTEDDWDRVMAVNLRGLFLGSREAA